MRRRFASIGRGFAAKPCEGRGAGVAGERTRLRRFQVPGMVISLKIRHPSTLTPRRAAAPQPQPSPRSGASTLNPQPSTLFPHPSPRSGAPTSTLNPVPSPLIPRRAAAPHPCILASRKEQQDGQQAQRESCGMGAADVLGEEEPAGQGAEDHNAEVEHGHNGRAVQIHAGIGLEQEI